LDRENVNTEYIKRGQTEGLGEQFVALYLRNIIQTNWGVLVSKLYSKRGLYIELKDVERLRE
jgi:hypothetical protein